MYTEDLVIQWACAQAGRVPDQTCHHQLEFHRTHIPCVHWALSVDWAEFRGEIKGEIFNFAVKAEVIFSTAAPCIVYRNTIFQGQGPTLSPWPWKVWIALAVQLAELSKPDWRRFFTQWESSRIHSAGDCWVIIGSKHVDIHINRYTYIHNAYKPTQPNA